MLYLPNIMLLLFHKIFLRNNFKRKPSSNASSSSCSSSKSSIKTSENKNNSFIHDNNKNTYLVLNTSNVIETNPFYLLNKKRFNFFRILKYTKHSITHTHNIYIYILFILIFYIFFFL